MKVPQFILAAILTVHFTVEGWIVTELVSQGKDIAAIQATLNLRTSAQK